MKNQTNVLLKAGGLFPAMNAAMLIGHFFSRWPAYRRAPNGFIVAFEVLALFFAILYYVEARRD